MRWLDVGAFLDYLETNLLGNCSSLNTTTVIRNVDHAMQHGLSRDVLYSSQIETP